MTENRTEFFNIAKATVLGPTLIQSEVDGCNAILDATLNLKAGYRAYALATAYHETAHTMQPVKENGGPNYFFRMYDIQGYRPAVARRLGNMQPGDGAKYYGRGYVQLTGRINYAKAEHELGVSLVSTPDLALNPTVAADILRLGMTEGWFTGKKFTDFAETDYVSMRKIINGTDRAALIAGYARQFEQAVRKIV